MCWTERALRSIRKSGYRRTKEHSKRTAHRMRQWAEPLFPVSLISSQFAFNSSAENSAQLPTARLPTACCAEAHSLPPCPFLHNVLIHFLPHFRPVLQDPRLT